MKKSVMKKMMAGLCAAAMLTTCSIRRSPAKRRYRSNRRGRKK